MSKRPKTQSLLLQSRECSNYRLLRLRLAILRRHSTVKHWICFLIGGAAVSWSSKRQRSVTLSSCEAEYVAACEATRELIWETAFIRELGYSIPTLIVHMDSQSALQLIHNPVFHDKSKHIQARMHYVRERVQEANCHFIKLRPT